MQLQLHPGAMAALLGHLRPALSAGSPTLLLSRALPRCRSIVDSTRRGYGCVAHSAAWSRVRPRYLHHVAVLAIAIGAAAAAVIIPNPFAKGDFALPAMPPARVETDLLVVSPIPSQRLEAQPDRVSIAAMEARAAASQQVDGKPAQPIAAPPKAKTPSKYRVEDGDTVGGIAERFGISSQTVMWANSLSDPDSLQIGEELVILPVSGVLHTVAGGDNLNDLALTYGVTPESIAEFNVLSDPDMLQLGDKLVVASGKMGVARTAVSRSAAPSPAATGSFRWPAGGSITQYFGEDGHTGVDLASPSGNPVYAAESGVVVTALKLGYGYGWHLVIDHGNGYRTLYGHLSAFNADYGEQVAKGDRIGSVGNTGLSTGPHLHFELIQNGGRVNPLKYLP
jgi:murein DD-endopeptidase MepM/ murein hydrolase activator NlpD